MHDRSADGVPLPRGCSVVGYPNIPLRLQMRNNSLLGNIALVRNSIRFRLMETIGPDRSYHLFMGTVEEYTMFRC